MIDDGIDSLSELVTVCNPFHGKYHIDTLFSSYAGVPIPMMVDDVNMEAVMSLRTGGWTIVDLNMPVIATPQNFTDLGFTIMNKAILHGPQRHYSVKSTWNLGKAGWVYCDADGVVWHLWADFGTTYAEVKVYGDPINVANPRPTTLLATFTVPVAPSPNQLSDHSSPYIATTFDPNGSGRAAIHVYVDVAVYDSTSWNFQSLNWSVAICALEVAVSGGAGSALAVTQTLLTNDGFFSVYDAAFSGFEEGPAHAITATVGHATPDQFIPPGGGVYDIHPQGIQTVAYKDVETTGLDISAGPGNAGYDLTTRERYVTFVGIVYDSNGVRHKIDYARENTQSTVTEFELVDAGQPVFLYWFRTDLGAQWPDGVWNSAQQVFDVGNFRPYVTKRTTVYKEGAKRGFRRDGEYIDPMQWGKTTTTVSTRVENAEVNPPVEETTSYDMNGYVRISPTYGVPEFTCAPYGSDYRFCLTMLAPGQFQTYAFTYSSPFIRRLGQYCTADYSGGFPWSNKWEVAPDARDCMPIPNPLDGSIDRKVIVYF